VHATETQLSTGPDRMNIVTEADAQGGEARARSERIRNLSKATPNTAGA
jgi:hypothetical protein